MSTEFWLCESGTGGSGHTVTAVFSNESYPVVHFLEITGAASGTSLDVHGVSSEDVPPQIVELPSATTQANEIIIAMITGWGKSGSTFSEANGYTFQTVEEDTSQFYPSAVASKVVSSTGTYPASFSYDQTGAFFEVASLAILSLKAAAGGGGSDTTPNAFTFTDQTSVPISSVRTSNTITITGIDAASAISISGGEYSKNGGSWTTSAGTVVVNDTVQVRHTSSASYGTATNTTLTVGGVSDTFTSTTINTRTASITLHNASDTNLASVSLQWFIESAWGNGKYDSSCAGTTSTDANGDLLLTGLTAPAGNYIIHVRIASDTTSNAAGLITLV